MILSFPFIGYYLLKFIKGIIYPPLRFGKHLPVDYVAYILRTAAVVSRYILSRAAKRYILSEHTLQPFRFREGELMIIYLVLQKVQELR